MLAVTGIGMVSALGLDVVTSCAAARAGLRRSAPIDDFWAVDEDAEEPVPVNAHRVPLLSAGLFGGARLLALALAAIDDLQRTWKPPTDRRVGLVLVLRSGIHRSVWLERLRARPQLAQRDVDLEAEEAEHASDRQRLSRVLEQVVGRLGTAIDPGAKRAIVGDQAAFVPALEQAAQWLAEGRCDACWVGGVDSYLDPATLEALAGLRLLRTPSEAAGMIPGELACFLALERADQVQAERRPAHARIRAFAHAGGAAVRLGEDPPTHAALLHSLTTAAADRRPGVMLVNLNGDAIRAAEWGNTLSRLVALGFDPHAPVWMPPLYFGEVGAATAPASVALLGAAWARGYAPSNDAVVALIEDGASRGAFSVAKN